MRDATKTAVILDLDGTLWDATEAMCAVWNGVLSREADISFRFTVERVRSLMGKTFETMAAEVFPDLPPVRRNALLRACADAELPALREHGGGKLYEGVEETLRTLSREHLLMIVSNCQEGYVRTFLDVCRLGAYFADYQESGDSGRTKGENLRRILERSRVERALYVGDTQGDADAARQAGLPFLFAAYGFGACSRPDGVLARFQDLPRLADALLNA